MIAMSEIKFELKPRKEKPSRRIRKRAQRDYSLVGDQPWRVEVLLVCEVHFLFPFFLKVRTHDTN